MINSVQTAIANVLHYIPHPILNMVFGSSRPLSRAICEEIIYEKIRQDCSLQGGLITELLLKSSYVIPSNGEQACLLRIPKEVRAGLAIVDVMQLVRRAEDGSYGSMGELSMLGMRSSDLFDRTMDNLIESISHSTSAMTDLPSVKLRGDLVVITPRLYDFSNIYLQCKLVYTEDFTNLPAIAVPAFSDLVLTAVKTHCYNKLVLESVSPKIESMIEQWSDLKSTYDEQLNVFALQISFDIDQFKANLEVQNPIL